MNLQDIIFNIFLFSAAVQLLYYGGVFSRFAFYAEKISKDGTCPVSAKPDPAPPVSVIICARNAAMHLRENLQSVLDQRYPDFEVIVADDASSDGTADILAGFAKKFNNLKIVTISPEEKNHAGKKQALTKGIESALHEILLLTDSDCHPAGTNWISSMVSSFSENTGIVTGYGGYSKNRGLLNALIRFDTFFIAIQYFSYTLCGMPYMGVGRNMAYRKSIFIEKNGFSNHHDLLSGDDDLFVSDAAKKDNVTINISPDATTISAPEKSFSDWINQKKRHLSTSFRFKPRHKFYLGIHNITQFLFITTFIFALFISAGHEKLYFVFFIRLIAQAIVFKKAMSMIGERDLFLLSPFIEAILTLLYPYMLISGLIYKEKKWR